MYQVNHNSIRPVHVALAYTGGMEQLISHTVLEDVYGKIISLPGTDMPTLALKY